MKDWKAAVRTYEQNTASRTNEKDDFLAFMEEEGRRSREDVF